MVKSKVVCNIVAMNEVHVIKTPMATVSSAKAMFFLSQSMKFAFVRTMSCIRGNALLSFCCKVFQIGYELFKMFKIRTHKNAMKFYPVRLRREKKIASLILVHSYP